MVEKIMSLYEGDESTLPLLPIIDGQLIICKDTGNIYKDGDGERNPLGGHVEVIDSLPLAPIERKLYYYTKSEKGLCYYEGGKWQFIVTVEKLEQYLETFKQSLHTHDNKDILDAIEVAYTKAINDKVSKAYTHSTSTHAPADAEKNIFTKIKVNGVEVVPNADREVNLESPKNIRDGSALNSVTIGTGQIMDSTNAKYAVAEGKDTKVSGEGSHAEGYGTKASGKYAHAEGSLTISSGKNSHSEGDSTLASNFVAHAEGYYTIASGRMSHTEGSNTVAAGENSHAEGCNNAAHNRSTHVSGEWANSPTVENGDESSRGTYVEIIGNGSGEAHRSNARTLDWNGNETLAGKLTVGKEPENDMDVVTKKYFNEHSSNPTQFKGATSTANGSSGLVPTPTKNDVSRFLKGNGTFSDIDSSDIKNLANVAKSGSYKDLKDTPKPYDDTSLRTEITKKFDNVNKAIEESTKNLSNIPTVLVNGEQAGNISFVWNYDGNFSIRIPGADKYIYAQHYYSSWQKLLKDNKITSYDPSHFKATFGANYSKIWLSDDIKCIDKLEINSGAAIALPNFLTSLNGLTNSSNYVFYLYPLPKSLTEIDEESRKTISRFVDKVSFESSSYYANSPEGDGLYVTNASGKYLELTSYRLKEIPDGITSIDENCFYHNSLKSVQIPSMVEEIRGFCDCPNLATITFQGTDEKYFEYAFNDCPTLTNITVPEGVTFIRGSFSNCGLRYITLPNTLTDLYEGAFSNLENLETIDIPKGVTYIDYDCFSDCPNLNSIWCYGETVPDGYPWGATNASVYDKDGNELTTF